MEKYSMECSICKMVHLFLDCGTYRWYEDQSVMQDFWEISRKLRCPVCKMSMQLPLKKCITCDFCNHSYCSERFNDWPVNKDHSCSANKEGTFDKERKQLLKNLLKRFFQYSEKCNACDKSLEVVDHNLDVIQIGQSPKTHDYFDREIKEIVGTLKLVGCSLNWLKCSLMYTYYEYTTGDAEKELNIKQEALGNLVLHVLELFRRVREDDLSAAEFSSLLSSLHFLGESMKAACSSMFSELKL